MEAGEGRREVEMGTLVIVSTIKQKERKTKVISK